MYFRLIQIADMTYPILRNVSNTIKNARQKHGFFFSIDVTYNYARKFLRFRFRKLTKVRGVTFSL